MRRLAPTALSAAALLFMPDLALACPGCIEGSDPGLYTGFLWGMGLMMVAPMLVVAGIGGGIVYTRRRALRGAVEGFLKEEADRS